MFSGRYFQGLLLTRVLDKPKIPYNSKMKASLVKSTF